MGDSKIQGHGPRDQRRNGGRARRGGRGNADRRSRSPERGTFRSGSHHLNRDASKDSRRRERTPLAGRMTRDSTPQDQQASGSPTPTPAGQTGTKRKREGPEVDQKQIKKARTGPREMHPATPQEKRKEPVAQAAVKREVTRLGITKLSEQERRALRAKKFGPAVVAEKDISKKKDGRKATDPVDYVSDTCQKVALKDTHDSPIFKATTTANEAPKVSTESNVPAKRIKEGRAPSPASLPSPSSSNESPPREKRPITKVQDPEEQGHQKQRPSPNRKVASLPKKNGSKPQPEPEPEKTTHSSAANKRAEEMNREIQSYVEDRKPFVELYPENVLDFIDYGVYSVPIMCSSSVQHKHSVVPVDEPSEELRRTLTQDAVALFGRKMIVLRQNAIALSRKKLLTSKDLGRAYVRKSEPTRVIDDCDLYLYEKKIYVATERGLLPAADYLKLIGIPDTQPVRFNGHKPAWMAVVKGKQHYRRVAESIKYPQANKKNLERQGLIELDVTTLVLVYEIGIWDRVNGQDIVMAYGVNIDGEKGWFPYTNTCRTNGGADPPSASTQVAQDPDIIDWATFDYSRLAKQAAEQQAAQAAARQVAAASLAATIATSVAASAVPSTLSPSTTPTPASQALEVASIHLSTSQEEDELSKLSVAGGIMSTSTEVEQTNVAEESLQVSRYGDPQARSKRTAHEKDAVNIEETDRFRNDTINAEDETVTEGGPIAEEEASTEQVASPPKKDVCSKPFVDWEPEDEVDWDF